MGCLKNSAVDDTQHFYYSTIECESQYKCGKKHIKQFIFKKPQKNYWHFTRVVILYTQGKGKDRKPVRTTTWGSGS